MKKIFTLFAAVAMMFAANAETLDVCMGESLASTLPIYGLWVDAENTTGQMIYPADMLADMVGEDITQLKFYTSVNGYEALGYEPQNGDYDYIRFSGATIQLSLKVVEEDVFTEAVAIEGTTPVAVSVPEVGDRYMTFDLEEPFHYEGGNLLVECKVIEAGSYGSCYFWVETFDTNVGYYEYVNTSGTLTSNMVTYLPAVTFTYGEEEPAFYVVGFNDWENPIEITEEGATVDVSAQNFDDPEDTAQEFKIITTNDNGATVWYGGVDDNQVGYFEIGEELLEHIITLDDEGVNFRLAEPGNYTIRLVFLDKAAASGMHLYVTKNEVTAVNGISAKAVAGVKYYNLAGVESNKPFNGINVVVTTYSDGTTSTSKMVK